MTTTTLPKLNTKALIHLAEWVGAQRAREELGLPSEWHQGTWLMKLDELTTVKVSPCGTACCVAGKAALEAGWVPSLSIVPVDDGYSPWTDGDTDEFVVKVDKKGNQVGDEREVEDVAMEVLGLTSHEAGILFCGDNDYDAVMVAFLNILNGSTRN